MEPEGVTKYQLAGLDDQERGFSRPVGCEQAGAQYRAILRYEAVLLSTDPQTTQEEALRALIRTLHARGFRQLKTQMSFRNGIYLGSQEMWVEYPDPPPPEGSSGFVARLMSWWRAAASRKNSPNA